jgi:hypothetical protein
MKILAATLTFAIALFSVESAFAYPARSLYQHEAFKQLRRQQLEAAVKADRAAVESLGFRPWKWSEPEPAQPANTFVMIPVHEEVRYDKAKEFINALASNKAELMELYKDKAPVTDDEYVMLARMAVGFLGAESEFFRSSRYLMKEACIFCFAAAKWGASMLGLADNDTMSRGPIQMKNVPDLIEQKYGITADDLNDPTNAARAIMGYLIEALQQLKRTAANNGLDHINKDTYVDYLPYIYFGSSHKLISRTATPDKNLYIQKMRTYMDWVEIHSRTNAQPMLAGEARGQENHEIEDPTATR